MQKIIMKIMQVLSNIVRSLPLTRARGRSWNVQESTTIPIILRIIFSICLLPFSPKLNLESSSRFIKRKISLSIPAIASTITMIIMSFIHCSNLWAEFCSRPKFIRICVMNSNILSVYVQCKIFSNSPLR